MKWLVITLAVAALALSGYALYKTKRVEAAAKPRIHLIAAIVP